MKTSKYTLTFCFFTLLLLLTNCKKREIIKLEFNPRMITKLDLRNTDSVTLKEYNENKLISSEKVALKYKVTVDTAYTAFKEAKYRFTLKKSFIRGYDYKLLFDIDNKKHEYYFQKIDYDTILNGKNTFYTTKSYILNNKKYDFADAVYYLD